MKSKNGFETGKRYELEVQGASNISGVIESIAGENIVVNDVLSGKKQTIDTKKIISATQIEMRSKGSYNVDAHGIGSGPGYAGGGPTERTTPNYSDPSGFGGSGSERKYHKSGCGCGKCGGGNCWIPY